MEELQKILDIYFNGDCLIEVLEDCEWCVDGNLVRWCSGSDEYSAEMVNGGLSHNKVKDIHYFEGDTQQGFNLTHVLDSKLKLSVDEFEEKYY